MIWEKSCHFLQVIIFWIVSLCIPDHTTITATCVFVALDRAVDSVIGDPVHTSPRDLG